MGYLQWDTFILAKVGHALLSVIVSTTVLAIFSSTNVHRDDYMYIPPHSLLY